MRPPLNGSPRVSCNNACHLRRGSAGGTDYAVGVGTPVYAPFDGHVTRHTGGTGGWRVRVRNPVTGHDFWALHLSGWVAANGAQVKEGQLIAYTGGAKGHPGAGTSTGPHLHAHVHDQTKRWGMEEYLASRPAGGGSAIPIIRQAEENDVVFLKTLEKRGTDTKKTPRWYTFDGFTVQDVPPGQEQSFKLVYGRSRDVTEVTIARLRVQGARHAAALNIPTTETAPVDAGVIAKAVADEIDQRTRERLS